MLNRSFGYAALGSAFLAGGLLQAHHSLAGVYDMKAEKELSGTVDKAQYTNPLGDSVTVVSGGGPND